MAARLSDQDIAALIAERKAAPSGLRQRLTTKLKRGHKEAFSEVAGAEGSAFTVIIRESIFSPFDFSVILGVELPKTGHVFRLRRYNGRHRHTNSIEGSSFHDFHIHFATERYQALGRDEDAFAEETSRYTSVAGAIDCMVSDCNFDLPTDPQGLLRFGRA